MTSPSSLEWRCTRKVGVYVNGQLRELLEVMEVPGNPDPEFYTRAQWEQGEEPEFREDLHGNLMRRAEASPLETFQAGDEFAQGCAALVVRHALAGLEARAGELGRALSPFERDQWVTGYLGLLEAAVRGHVFPPEAPVESASD